MRYVGDENAGVVSGFGNFCANLGAFAFTYGIGAVKQATGSFDVAMWTLAGLCLVGVAAVALISRVPVTASSHAAEDRAVEAVAP
ncbi:hypothetical protein JCM18899A_10470 [Nocardioides sp. AN3]